MNQILPIIDAELVDETTTTAQCTALAKVVYDSIPVHQRHPEDWTNLAAYVSKGDLQGLQRVAESLTINNTTHTTYNVYVDNRIDNSNHSRRSHTTAASPLQGVEVGSNVVQGVLAMVAFLALLGLAGGGK